jgi:hypothetical protein
MKPLEVDGGRFQKEKQRKKKQLAGSKIALRQLTTLSLRIIQIKKQTNKKKTKTKTKQKTRTHTQEPKITQELIITQEPVLLSITLQSFVLHLFIPSYM